jgi:hypothetical protein
MGAMRYLRTGKTMKKLSFWISYLLLLACGCVEAVEPRQALTDFKASAKSGDFEVVWKKMLKLPGLPPENEVMYRDKVRKDMTRFKEGLDFEIIDQKVDGDCAVILINQINDPAKRAANYDPIYLLKQEGEWRFFPSLSNYRQAAQIAPETVERFERLQAWYEQQEKLLKHGLSSE